MSAEILSFETGRPAEIVEDDEPSLFVTSITVAWSFATVCVFTYFEPTSVPPHAASATVVNTPNNTLKLFIALSKRSSTAAPDER